MEPRFDSGDDALRWYNGWIQVSPTDPPEGERDPKYKWDPVKQWQAKDGSKLYWYVVGTKGGESLVIEREATFLRWANEYYANYAEGHGEEEAEKLIGLGDILVEPIPDLPPSTPESELLIDEVAPVKKGKVAPLKANAELTALLRPLTKKSEVREAALLLREAERPDNAPESGIFEVIIVDEGLGNRKNMNYYGPEAVDSAPAAFEGKSCFIDHPTESEDRERPERSTWHKAGYYKGCRVITHKGKKACVAQLHLDNSEAGKDAAAKCRAALHYQKEFPGSDEEYVGLSVNADGDTETRRMIVEGEDVEVNYVTAFTQAASVDLVTTPARGGKILALVESAAGAILATREKRTMIIKTLKAAQAALKEAATLKDPVARNKKMAEASKVLDTLLLEAAKAVAKAKEANGNGNGKGEEGEDDPTADKAKEAADMYEKGSAMVAQAVAMGHKVPSGEAEPSYPDTADKPREGKEMGDHEEDDVMGYEKKESKKLAIKHLLKEAGVSEKFVDFDSLCKVPLKEATKAIANVKELRESIAKDILKTLDTSGAGHGPKHLTESGEGVNQDIMKESLSK